LDDATPRGHAVRRRKLWIELYRSLEQAQRFRVTVPRIAHRFGNAPQIDIVGIEVFRWLALCTFNLSLFQFRPDCATTLVLT
jgi:hypothetical protein